MDRLNFCLFLDRDGVINEKLENDYVKNLKEFKFIENSLKAVTILSRYFNRIFIVTNQQGIGKKLMDFKALEEIHNFMLSEIEKEGGFISKIYVCPHLENENCNCRKPKTGLYYMALADFPEIKNYGNIMVGDSETDMLFGRNLKMTNVLISKNVEIDSNLYDYTFNNLHDFAKHIDEIFVNLKNRV